MSPYIDTVLGITSTLLWPLEFAASEISDLLLYTYCLYGLYSESVHMRCIDVNARVSLGNFFDIVATVCAVALGAIYIFGIAMIIRKGMRAWQYINGTRILVTYIAITALMFVSDYIYGNDRWVTVSTFVELIIVIMVPCVLIGGAYYILRILRNL